MAHVDLIQYEQASEEVKEVFDDIRNFPLILDIIKIFFDFFRGLLVLNQINMGRFLYLKLCELRIVIPKNTGTFIYKDERQMIIFI